MRLLAPFAAVLALTPAVGRAYVNLNIDQPIYTFASYDLAGNSIPNQISYSYPFGTPTADNGTIPFWTATTTFAEPAAGEVLDLYQLRPDDRTVVLLNGVVVGAYGGNGPGLSTFVFAPGGPEVPQYFLNSCCEQVGHALNAVVFGPFVPGVNTLEFIVNNTNAGIWGTLTDEGPSRLSFEGFIGVPDLATWALMLIGFTAVGALRRSRRGEQAA